MTEIALISLILLSTVGILDDILRITYRLPRRINGNEYGICIVLHITWIFICIVALLVGGSFASAAISIATVYAILSVIGGLFACVKYGCISDGIGLALWLVLLTMFLAI